MKTIHLFLYVFCLMIINSIFFKAIAQGDAEERFGNWTSSAMNITQWSTCSASTVNPVPARFTFVLGGLPGGGSVLGIMIDQRARTFTENSVITIQHRDRTFSIQGKLNGNSGSSMGASANDPQELAIITDLMRSIVSGGELRVSVQNSRLRFSLVGADQAMNSLVNCARRRGYTR